MYGQNRITYLEVFNLLGSICSIIALLIVLSSSYENSSKIIIIIISFLLTFSFLGWLFRFLIIIYQNLSKEYNFSIWTNIFLIAIGVCIAVTIITYTFYLSYLITEGITEFVSKMIDAINKEI